MTTPPCVGCGCAITDQYILRVDPDLEWHASCLKCADCGQMLDENCTCFVRDGKTYCKSDYTRGLSAVNTSPLIHYWYKVTYCIPVYFSSKLNDENGKMKPRGGSKLF
ncbi:DgyrCDS12271 [Dimorphilus gyrociliatus]|uniref:DgyrCDS12271 n=1 Tax=Dimorphilus gyrociliatus TaxID=2664684 RepID=A0A7I8W5Z8_9ANNE|nr:DgyrCDS12271 [Dimorphilus gyrociliatus]